MKLIHQDRIQLRKGGRGWFRGGLGLLTSAAGGGNQMMADLLQVLGGIEDGMTVTPPGSCSHLTQLGAPQNWPPDFPSQKHRPWVQLMQQQGTPREPSFTRSLIHSFTHSAFQNYSLGPCCTSGSVADTGCSARDKPVEPRPPRCQRSRGDRD